MQANTWYRFKRKLFWVLRYLIVFLCCSIEIKVHLRNIENIRSSESKIQIGSIFQGEISFVILFAPFGRYWRVVVKTQWSEYLKKHEIWLFSFYLRDLWKLWKIAPSIIFFVRHQQHAFSEVFEGTEWNFIRFQRVCLS